MSSILDALRELESARPRKPTQVVTPLEMPGRVDRIFDAAMPLVGGVAAGIVVFGAALWALSRLPASAPSTPVAAPVAPASDPASPRPSWLDTAEAPRARVGGVQTAERVPRADSPGRTAPERPARTVDERVTGEPETEATSAAPPRAEPKGRPNAGPLVVELIHYSPMASERTVTLRVNGRRVTLHQRESAEGIEVQLIQPNGVYVQRGAEVFLATIDR